MVENFEKGKVYRSLNKLDRGITRDKGTLCKAEYRTTNGILWYKSLRGHIVSSNKKYDFELVEMNDNYEIY